MERIKNENENVPSKEDVMERLDKLDYSLQFLRNKLTNLKKQGDISLSNPHIHDIYPLSSRNLHTENLIRSFKKHNSSKSSPSHSSLFQTHNAFPSASNPSKNQTFSYHNYEKKETPTWLITPETNPASIPESKGRKKAKTEISKKDQDRISIRLSQSSKTVDSRNRRTENKEGRNGALRIRDNSSPTVSNNIRAKQKEKCGHGELKSERRVVQFMNVCKNMKDFSPKSPKKSNRINRICGQAPAPLQKPKPFKFSLSPERSLTPNKSERKTFSNSLKSNLELGNRTLSPRSSSNKKKLLTAVERNALLESLKEVYLKEWGIEINNPNSEFVDQANFNIYERLLAQNGIEIDEVLLKKIFNNLHSQRSDSKNTSRIKQKKLIDQERIQKEYWEKIQKEEMWDNRFVFISNDQPKRSGFSNRKALFDIV